MPHTPEQHNLFPTENAHAEADDDALSSSTETAPDSPLQPNNEAAPSSPPSDTDIAAATKNFGDSCLRVLSNAGPFVRRGLFHPDKPNARALAGFVNADGLRLMVRGLHEEVLSALAPLGIKNLRDIGPTVKDHYQREEVRRTIDDAAVLPIPELQKWQSRLDERFYALEIMQSRADARRVEINMLLALLKDKKTADNQEEVSALENLLAQEMGALQEESTEYVCDARNLQSEQELIRAEKEHAVRRAAEAANRYNCEHLSKNVLNSPVELQREEVTHASSLGALFVIAADDRHADLVRKEAVRKIWQVLDLFIPIQWQEGGASDDMRYFFNEIWRKHFQPPDKKIGEMEPGHVFRFSLDEKNNCATGQIYNLAVENHSALLEEAREQFTHEIRLFTRKMTIFKGAKGQQRDIDVEIAARTKSDTSQADKADRKDMISFDEMADRNGVRLVFTSENDFADFLAYVQSLVACSDLDEVEVNYQGITGYYKFSVKFDGRQFEFQCFTPPGLINYTRGEKSWQDYLLERTFRRSRIIENNFPPADYPAIDKERIYHSQKARVLAAGQAEGRINEQYPVNSLQFNSRQKNAPFTADLPLNKISEFLPLLFWDPLITNQEIVAAYGNNPELIIKLRALHRVLQGILTAGMEDNLIRLRDLQDIVGYSSGQERIRTAVNNSKFFLNSPELNEREGKIKERQISLDRKIIRKLQRHSRYQTISALLGNLGFQQAFEDCFREEDSASGSGQTGSVEIGESTEEIICPGFGSFNLSDKMKSLTNDQRLIDAELARQKADRNALEQKRLSVFRRASNKANLFIHDYLGAKLGIDDHSLQGVEIDFLHTPGDLFLYLCNPEIDPLLRKEALRKLFLMCQIFVPLHRHRDRNNDDLAVFMEQFWNKHFKPEDEKIGTNKTDLTLFYNRDPDTLQCSTYVVVSDTELKEGAVDVTSFSYSRPLHCRNWVVSDDDKNPRPVQISPIKTSEFESAIKAFDENSLALITGDKGQNRFKMVFMNQADFEAWYKECFRLLPASHISIPQLNFKGIEGCHLFAIYLPKQDRDSKQEKLVKYEIIALTPAGEINYEGRRRAPAEETLSREEKKKIGVGKAQYDTEKVYDSPVLPLLFPERYYGALPLAAKRQAMIDQIHTEQLKKDQR